MHTFFFLLFPLSSSCWVQTFLPVAQTSAISEQMNVWKNKCKVPHLRKANDRWRFKINHRLTCSKPFWSNTFNLPVPKRIVLFSIILFLRRIEDWVGCTCVQKLPFILSSISADRKVSFICLLQSRVILIFLSYFWWTDSTFLLESSNLVCAAAKNQARFIHPTGKFAT